MPCWNVAVHSTVDYYGNEKDTERFADIGFEIIQTATQLPWVRGEAR